MDRVPERDRDKSSHRSRDDRDRERDSSRSDARDHHRHREREREREHKHRHHHGDDHDEDRRNGSKRERSLDRVRDSVERERVRDSVERDRVRDSVERERVSHSSRKRKDHDYDYCDGDEENGDKKRARASDDRKERRRFEEENGDYKVKDEELSDVEGSRKRKREGRRFSDSVKVKEEKEGRDEAKSVGRKESRVERRFKDRVKEEDFGGEEEGKKVVAQEPLTVASEVSMTPAAASHPLRTKVSSITTTNENEGVSIIRSDEVTGKSSTDGTTTSVAGKSGSLSLDALAKAKKALQMQKELSEKLKKIPTLNKLASTSNSQVASNREGKNVTPATTSMTSVQLTSSSAGLPVGATTTGTGTLSGLANQPAIEAVKRAQELAAKMGYRQDPEFAPLINMFPGSSTVPEMAAPRPSKVPVLRLDAQGREIDEHGNVINMPKLTNLSTLKVNINKQKKEAFQILRPELDADIQSNPHFDERMGLNKTKLLRPKRMSFQFVEEGKWAKQAEITKIKNQFGEAQSKELKVKQSQLAKAKAEPDDNPNLIAIGERVFKEKKKDEIPEIEWWDKPLLPSGSYTDDAEEKLNMEKITIYVEHPRPIEPPAEPAPPPPQPLKLTKKEQKKLRTQRRLAKEKDRQEMIRQGLLEPPKPKVKMSNLMKVLGSEATQDPTRLEMEIRSAAAEREQAHVDRNIARKETL
ncbi:uncharacterized protein A4U43_C07F35690 [Asparagus officinalis]|uniref:Pre-mRNA-splicing factor 3 domain-containing protein n=1 Tax=Asparagus officinalis TaxID=4686 RepID=A0A5P1EH92_ASPOF|nr:uncharacterized protein A4U43_C07F35690 [Asparagus officinalis]